MMSKTHIAVGLASAFALRLPNTVEAALPVVVGAAIGSLIFDIDTKSTSYVKDALEGRINVGIIVGMSVFIDFLFQGIITTSVLGANIIVVSIGILGLLLVGIFARKSKHRSFSHSFLALFLEGLSLAFICPPVVPSFIIACISHLLLDVMNKKGIKLFFPAKKDFCLKWFYSDKTANKVFLIVGCSCLVLSIGFCVIIS